MGIGRENKMKEKQENIGETGVLSASTAREILVKVLERLDKLEATVAHLEGNYHVWPPGGSI